MSAMVFTLLAGLAVILFGLAELRKRGRIKATDNEFSVIILIVLAAVLIRGLALFFYWADQPAEQW